MHEPTIVDLGDGPKVAGTRITIFTILEYMRLGRSRDWIAALLNLSSRQVDAAIEYIRRNQADVDAEYEKILERISNGNSPEVQERLRLNQKQLRERLRGARVSES